MVKKIIIVTVCVFCVQFLLAGDRSAGLMLYLFGLSPVNAVSHLWVWQFVTYMFLHDTGNIFHILFNMLLLYWFGREIETILGPRRFLAFYLMAGAFAGVAFCMVHLFQGLRSPVIGASGAVMAVLVAYAICYPNQLILFFFVFPMKVRTCVLILIGIDLYSGLQGSQNGVANFAHLGGALFGFVYWKGRPFLERSLTRLKEWRASRKKTVDLDEQQDLDRILEKISREGMGSLTKGERSFLLRASERRQRQKVSHEGHA